jgi:PBP1b-binding outer membrane lipoprotein LpoB
MMTIRVLHIFLVALLLSSCAGYPNSGEVIE